MTLHSFNRWTAFGAHLVLSALIAATVIGLVMWLWYPAPYFSAMGGETLLPFGIPGSASLERLPTANDDSDQESGGNSGSCGER